MKRNYFFLAAASVCSCLCLAQPVLTASGMNPVPGEIIVLKRTQSLPPGGTGANQTWNLSAMSSNGTSNFSVGTAAQAPMGSSFPNANMQYNDGTIYSFWKTSSTALTHMGVYANNTAIPYSNGEDFLHFPFSYNNTFTDTWSSVYTSGVTFTRTGTSTITYDSYGTLTTPGFSNLNNVARVHFVQVYKDSSSITTMNYTNDQYLWYVNGYHQPIASVFTLVTMAFSNTTTTSAGYYADNVSSTVSLEEFNALPTVMLAPNPSSDKVVIGLSSGEALAQVRLFDLKGAMVIEKLNVDEGRVELDVSALAPGIYFAKVQSASGSLETRKVEVSR